MKRNAPRGLLLPLLLAPALAAPARAQQMEPIGEWFGYVAATPTNPEAVMLFSLGDQERGMLVVWSCPRGNLAISMVPREGVPDGDVRVSWRLDADPADTAATLRSPRGQPALVLQLDRALDFTRGAARSSWLVMRLIAESGPEREWAFSVQDADTALGRLSCARAAREADPDGWDGRAWIPMPDEVRQIQGEPPPAMAPPTSAVPPSAPPRLLNEDEGVRRMRARYDPLLRDAGVTGTAVVDLRLNGAGEVQRAVVVEATNPAFRSPAEHAAYRLRFSPPGPGQARVRVRMEFHPREGRIQVVEP